MITAKKLKAGQGKTPFPISIGVGGGDGEIVDITDPDQRRKMNGEQKQAAIQQVSATIVDLRLFVTTPNVPI